MRITVDTNVLVRALLQDDAVQSPIAAQTLKNATLIAIPLPCLCEMVWILRRGVKLAKKDIILAIRALLATRNVVLNRQAVEAGLALLEAGGDFADGAIEHEGRGLGGETFVSFDRQAIELLERQGQTVRLLS